MQKSGFPKMRHYVGFSQIGSHIVLERPLIDLSRHLPINPCTSYSFINLKLTCAQKAAVYTESR